MGLRNSLNLLKSFAKEGFDISLAVGKFFCCLHVVNSYLVTPALTSGPSMLPTLNLTPTIVLAERLSPRFNKLSPGDVVLVRSPEVPRKIVTKRVIGVEGDRIAYVVDPQNGDQSETIVVPKGHIWIQGDNIYNSYDSRNFGAVPYGLLEAKIFWKLHTSISSQTHN
ncbi:mitochondrial inner membrane protease subunit 1-like isoform X2 [Pistacia vera]|uniref:mitochondrial inner membrane protease subunit 1-like isoform X2 n=1 Tax=Pistacia vera TaxID=55513 RepID=UPI001262EA48|nr:mitochondrial inner membrane protease subunit 1-like isoform X2 [Pistacia vera]